MKAKTPNYPEVIEAKETLKETIDKLHEHIKKLETKEMELNNNIIKLNNRLQLIKAMADVGFV